MNANAAGRLLRRATTLIHKHTLSTSDYWLTRFVLLRVLGFVYLFAFLSLAMQVLPLIGSDGLLPAEAFVDAYGSHFESRAEAFVNLPSLFWLNLSDAWLVFFSWLGVILSLMLLFGLANAPLLLALWFLYLSFVHIGQVWYSYGWEIQLLEAGFTAVFLAPLIDPRPFARTPPPVPVIWLFRWLAFRINLGAGLIKMRGDSCWRDLTCLFYHYETQPIPNPLSPYFHFMPQWFHKFGALATHFVQLAVPFFLFVPGLARLAGVLLIGYQLVLITTGNYSFLNWVTILPAIAALDDRLLGKIMPKWIKTRAESARESAKPNKLHTAASLIFFAAVLWLSVPVVQNLLSENQAMNTSYDRVHIVNTYGAFGSVGRERYELVVQGTGEQVITSDTAWQDYEFKAKPTNLSRPLPVIAPYQPRIDWQIWFAAMSSYQQHPWMIHLVWKLLHNDEGAISLIERNPFPDAPPKYIRVEIYRYQFAKPDEKTIWHRERLGTWLPPLSTDNPQLQGIVRVQGWRPAG